jgi:hypothetical protein
MNNNQKIVKINPPLWGLVLATLVALALIFYLGVLSWNGIKKHESIGKADQETYTITISGEGKVSAVPDIAKISLGVQTEKSKVADAQKENSDKMNKIITELKGMGIEEKDLRTSDYSVYPTYDWINGKQILRGYQITQTAEIKIRNLELVSQVVAKAAELGANQVGGLTFTIDEPEQLRQQAREKALANAKTKAEALAVAAGVGLGKLVSFTEESGSPSAYLAYNDYSAKAMGGGSVAPVIESGSQDVIVYITVTYEVN